MQCRPVWARRVLRAAPAVLIVSLGAAAADWLEVMPAGSAAVLLSSGPWGWATVPAFSAASHVLSVPQPAPAFGALGSPVPALVAAAALVALTGLAVAAALRQLQRVPVGELRRRAAIATSLVASAVYAADVRSGSRARRKAITALLGRRFSTRPAPHRQALAVPWSGALMLLRCRERVAHTIAWVSGAAAAGWWLWQSDWQAAAPIVATALAYPAASALAEPLRVELEERLVTRTGPLPLGAVLHRQALPADQPSGWKPMS